MPLVPLLWQWTGNVWNTATQYDGPLLYGVNIHPISGPIYASIGAPPVISFLSDPGMTVARMDFYDPSETGVAASWCAALSHANMVGLPILIGSWVSGNEAGAYVNGCALGSAMALACSAYTHYYEMGNEFDDAVGYSGDGLQPQ